MTVRFVFGRSAARLRSTVQHSMIRYLSPRGQGLTGALRSVAGTMNRSLPEDPFHPDLRLAALLLPRQAVAPATVRPIRRSIALTARRDRGDVEVVDLGPGVRIRVHRPANQREKSPALLWIHGGGYVIGQAQQDDALCARFAARLGIVVAAVDYPPGSGASVPSGGRGLL